MKIIYIFLTLALLMPVSFSCADDTYETRLVYRVNKIEITKIQVPETILQVRAVVPNPCYRFSHLEVDHRENYIDIKIYAKVKKDINCIQVLGTIDVPVPLNFDKHGDYRIHFSGRSAAMDTLISVPETQKSEKH